MYSIEFCRAPSQYWVGVIDYNGGHVFVSGRTLDDLLKHGKTRMNTEHKVSRTQVFLSSRQTDFAEFFRKYGVFMHPIFMGRYWQDKNKAKPVPVEPVVKRADPAASIPPVAKQSEYIAEKEGNYMVVYELREVARYKLFGKKLAQEQVPSLATTPTSLVLSNTDESQEENL